MHHKRVLLSPYHVERASVGGRLSCVGVHLAVRKSMSVFIKMEPDK